MRKNGFDVSEQQRQRQVCASKQFDQRLGNSLSAQLATCKVSLLYLIYICEQTGLTLTWSETLETVVLARCPYRVIIVTQIIVIKMIKSKTNS